MASKKKNSRTKTKKVKQTKIKKPARKIPKAHKPTFRRAPARSKPQRKPATTIQPSPPPEALVRPEAPPVRAIPSRAPRKVIVDAKAGIQVVDATAPSAPLATAVALNEAPAPASPELQPAPALPQMAWRSLPESVPLVLRVLADLSAAECQRAASSPFSFARFMAALPTLIGGYELLALVLSVDHEAGQAAAMLNLEAETVSRGCQTAADILQENLYESCPDMHRHWSAMLNGTGLKEQQLIEPYLVPGIEHSFQVLVGRILLKALRARNNKVVPINLKCSTDFNRRAPDNLH